MRHLLTALTFVSVFQAGLSAQEALLHIRWEYKNLPGKMELYEALPGDKNALWFMQLLRPGDVRPYGKRIENSDIRVKPGMNRMFYLVYRNPGSKTEAFFAAPHSISPPEVSLGFKFHCLCINHVYKVPPGYEWIRLVRADLDKEFSGSELTATHILVSVDPSRGATDGDH